MARRGKRNVDYFPHMVNHGKSLTILQNKFGLIGYAFWFKLLEEVGKAEDHFLDCRDEVEFEYLIAQIGVESEQAEKILDLLAKLGSIDGDMWRYKIVFSSNFIGNIADAYARRSDSCIQKSDLCIQLGLNADINAQSKGEYSKEKKESMSSPSASDDDAPQKPFPKPPKAPPEGAGGRIPDARGAGADQGDKSKLLKDCELIDGAPFEERAAIKMWKYFAEMYPKHKTIRKATLEKWSRDLRLLNEADGRSWQEIRDMFDFIKTAEDPFWRTTISSAAGFRDNFDKMEKSKKKAKEKAKKQEQPIVLKRRATTDEPV